MNQGNIGQNGTHPDDPRDEALEHAYRATPREAPPQALDDRILAAAHRAVGARPAPARPDWTRRWRVPLSVAATVVLSATLTLMVYESEQAPPPLVPARPPIDGGLDAAPRSRAPEAPAVGASRVLMEQSPARSDEAATDALRDAERGTASAPQPPGKADARTAPEAAQGATPGSALRAAPQRQEIPASALPPVAPAPFPAGERAVQSAPPPEEADRTREQAAPLAKERAPIPSQKPRPGPRVAPAAPAPAAPAKREAESVAVPPFRARAARSNEERAVPERPATEAGTAAAPAAGRAPQLVTPEDWVAEIRRLRREGRDAEAAERLAELKTRFPGFVLPDDLR